MEGDYDAGAVSPQDAAARLRQSGIAALIYTTPSHTADAFQSFSFSGETTRPVESILVEGQPLDRATGVPSIG